MGIITISRQIGSEGTSIARSVATELNLVLIDKEDIARVMAEYGFVTFSEIYNSQPNFWSRWDDHRRMTVNFLLTAVKAFAKAGECVLLGRGAFGLLQEYTDILNVRLKAPLGLRMMRKQREHGGSDKQSREVLIREEEIRKAFVTRDLLYSYDDASLFDLVLDTGIVQPDEAAAIITSSYRHLMAHPRIDARHSRVDLEVDEVLLKLVEEFWDEKRRAS
jgi:cytidylate kinase